MAFLKRCFATSISAFIVLMSISSSNPALAASYAYDGSWSLLFVTRTGDCDPTYNFNVNVARGQISHPNLVRFRGNVTRTGLTRASVGVGNKYASGSGRLVGSSGGGSWSGYSGTGRCSGRWTAQRN